MPDIVTEQIKHPVAWRADDFGSLDDIAVVLTPSQRRSLVALGRAVCADGRRWQDLTPEEEALPELAATVMAALRREGAIAIGNVIGSNIFNLLGIMGVTALVAPLRVPGEVMRFDIWIMAATAIVVLAFVAGRWRISRPAGFALVAAYCVYCWSVFSFAQPALAG